MTPLQKLSILYYLAGVCQVTVYNKYVKTCNELCIIPIKCLLLGYNTYIPNQSTINVKLLLLVYKKIYIQNKKVMKFPCDIYIE